MFSFESPYYCSNGYGSMARNIIFALDKLTDNFCIRHIEGHPQQGVQLTEQENKILKKLEKRKVDIKIRIRADLAILFRKRSELTFTFDKKYSIGWTMFETDKLPFNWIQSCKVVNEVWVPSNFCADLFKNSGINNVRIMPLGIDLNKYNLNVNSLKREGLKDFVFLNVADFIYRKGIDLLLKAFTETFSSFHNVTLLLKTSSCMFSKQQIEKHVKEFMNSIRKDEHPSVVVWHKQLSDAEMPSLYKMVDIQVLPTRNEAFGLTLLEGIAVGVPNLVTGYSGHMDFCNDNNSYLIRTVGWKKAEYFGLPANFYQGCNFIEPDYNHLKELLIKSYNKKEYDAKKQQGLKDVKNFSSIEAAKKILQRIKEIY